MKKLLSVMIGLGLLMGTTALSFAQDQNPQKTEKKKRKHSKKKSADKKDETKS